MTREAHKQAAHVLRIISECEISKERVRGIGTVVTGDMTEDTKKALCAFFAERIAEHEARFEAL